ncbi:hypothetical protein GWK47_031404 [Chionoecetes opilio]|uniref:Platelet-derived growth factor (PDGF) family profile domain-containing protein n=1 Tax=Chionoecetes opilio TaxID=41210 RepID=A0A8J4YIX3_CHIOP|nr:hypothetical protein GWK47_001040 [Chionoecetes opilio]KAG0728933.1 hypothetical protein GWK47_031404 [Chionoecetes opilio]
MAATSQFLIVTLTVCLSGVLCLPGDLDADIKLKEQREALQKLECEPKATWVYIESQLEPHDDLPDKTYYPHVVSVRRCLKECSFCGNAMMGVPDKTCKPDTIEPRDVVVQLFNDVERTRTITLMEHKSCKCM